MEKITKSGSFSDSVTSPKPSSKKMKGTDFHYRVLDKMKFNKKGMEHSPPMQKKPPPDIFSKKV